ncbi:Heme-binding protein [Aureococcus anophagefferens]|nr:Heme-binding protein [Aureococcus anophagefferens]
MSVDNDNDFDVDDEKRACQPPPPEFERPLFACTLLLQANALAPTLRTLLRRRATVADREAALAQVMGAPDRDALLDECLQPSRIPRWLARAPVSWPARDLAALERVLKLGGELDDAARGGALLSTLRQLPEAAAPSGATRTSPSCDGRAGAGRAEGLELQNPKMAGAGAFQALAGYIFGGNGREEKMAMTTRAAYNDPFTPPWRRRNEVLVAVEAAN